VLPTDADDNTLIVVDWGNSLLGFVYGVAAGRLIAGRAAYFGTKGQIVGDTLNGEPLDYPGREEVDREIAAGNRRIQILPHVVGQHKKMQEAHVFEDIMQLVDWIREDKPTPVTAEQARHVVDIIEAAFRAAETGMTQELRTSF
jgi:predicted dehydrogenase